MTSAPDRAGGIVAPETRDLADLSARLADWLGARLPGASELRLVNFDYPRGAGMSHETILFDAEWREDGRAAGRGMVVRIKPTRQQVYCDDMFVEQYELMRVMHRSGEVRVAEVLWIEDDPALLGAPFFVMEKVAGRVAVSYPPYAQQGWLFDAAPADRRRLWEDSVGQLAAIQKVPVAAAPFLARVGEDGPEADAEIVRWRRFLAWIDPAGERRELRDAFAALLASRPDGPEGIVWGDARLGNMMVGDDYRVAAVMDWEQPSLGGALHDLGWWLRSDYNQTAGRGLAPLAGMGDRAETIALWSEVAGKSAAGIEWYEEFAAFKMACLAVRMTALRGGLPG